MEPFSPLFSNKTVSIGHSKVRFYRPTNTQLRKLQQVTRLSLTPILNTPPPKNTLDKFDRGVKVAIQFCNGIEKFLNALEVKGNNKPSSLTDPFGKKIRV